MAKNDVGNKSVSIYIDDTAAQDALQRLQKNADGFNKKLEEGRKKQEQLTDAIAKAKASGQSYSKLEQDLRLLGLGMSQTEKSVQKNVEAQKALQQQIDSKSGPSLRQQEQLVRRLENEFKGLGSNTAEAADKLEELGRASQVLNTVRERLDAVKRVQKDSASGGNFITSFFGNLAAGAVQSGLNLLQNAVGSLVTNNSRLSDSFSDIEKATGLSSAGVERLNTQLEGLDTRTTNEELREIAVGLGQVGEAANSANVEALDKIVVALGDEFGGGANQITKELSVLRNNLADIKSGNYASDVMNIGNALNELGAKGLATAPVVTDIANRIAGVGQTFHISSGAILGTAATFQELGISAERGSTAYVSILQKMAQEPAKFAKVAAFAGVSAKEFTNLVNTDMQAAFVAVATGAQKAGKDNVTFSKILKELDADGAGAGEVLAKLGTNAGMLAEKTGLATTALKSNSSILEEFNKKNNNAAAEVEKLKKNFESLFTSSTFTGAIQTGAKVLNGFVNVLKGIPEFVAQNRYALLTLAAGLVTLNLAYIKTGLSTARASALTVADTVIKRASVLINNIATAGQLAYAYAVDFLRGRITLAIAAQRIWSAVMALGAGPIGVILVAVGALAVAMGALLGSTKALSAEQRVQADISKRVADSTSDTVEKMRMLTEVAGDNNVSLDDRKKALNALIEIAPNYLKGLTLENIQTAEGKKILDGYIISLSKKAEIEAKVALADEKRKQRNQANLDLEKADKNLPTSTIGMIGGAMADMVGVGPYATFDKAKEAVKGLDEEIKTLQADIDKAAKENITDLLGGGNTGTGKTGNGGTGGIDFGDKDKEKDAARKKILEDQKRLKEELEKNAISLIPDDLWREIQQLEKVYADQRELAHGNKELLLQAEDQYQQKRQKIIADYSHKMMEAGQKQSAEELAEQDRKLNSLERLSSVVITDMNKSLSAAMSEFSDKEQEKIKKNINQGKLDELTLTKLQSSGKKKLDAELALLKEQERQELEQKDLTEVQKDLIEEQYRQQRKEKELAYYTGMIDTVLSFAQQALSVLSTFNEAKKAQEDRELKQLEAKNNKEKSAYKKLLDSKVISKKEYDRRVSGLDADADAKKQEIEKKQFERNKKMQRLQALINGAQAVTRAAAEYPFPFSLIPIAFAVATTTAQVMAINRTKFAKGGYLTGPSHAAGGMPVINPRTGQAEAEVEGGEVILSKNTVRNNSGMVSALLDSSMNRGGQSIEPWFRSRPYKGIDYTSLSRTVQRVRYFENGGTLAFGAGASQQPAAAQQVEQFSTASLEAVMHAVIKKLDEPSRNFVVLSDVTAKAEMQSDLDGESVFRKKG